jgi:hypothetical protein
MLQLPLYLSGCDFKSEKDYRRGGGATGACVIAERKLAILDMLCLYLTSLVADLRRLVTGLSPGRPSLDPRPVHVGFVVDKVMLGQVFI